MNPSRFIALYCGDETEVLVKRHPHAFLLLLQIAMRAKWKDCPITGLKAGQAFIGDWKNAGIPSEMAYRHAKKTLLECRFATFRGTSKGTVATLTDSRIFSITSKSGTGTATTQQRTRNGQGTTNHTDIQNVLSTIHTHNRATIEEVTAFCLEIGLLATDGHFMFHKWESNSWTNKGGEPILNWKALIRSWKSAKYLPSQSSNNPNKPTSAYEFGAL